MKKAILNRKKVNTSVLILILTISTCNILGSIFLDTSSSFNHESDEIDSLDTIPKISDNEVQIITPENKTYSTPMSGYYPVTYGFEEDKNGNIPWNWNVEGSAERLLF